MKEATFDQQHNFLVTPRWMLQSQSESSWYIWNIEPASTSGFNAIELNFAGIHHDPDESVECSMADHMNMVIIRSGVGISSPVVAAYCLNELPPMVRVPSVMARVEFYTTNSTMYGFVAEYTTGKIIIASSKIEVQQKPSLANCLPPKLLHNGINAKHIKP